MIEVKEKEYIVSQSALEEAKTVINNLYKTGTSSGQYMASGGNVILTVLGLLKDDTLPEEKNALSY